MATAATACGRVFACGRIGASRSADAMRALSITSPRPAAIRLIASAAARCAPPPPRSPSQLPTSVFGFGVRIRIPSAIQSAAAAESEWRRIFSPAAAPFSSSVAHAAQTKAASVSAPTIHSPASTQGQLGKAADPFVSSAFAASPTGHQGARRSSSNGGSGESSDNPKAPPGSPPKVSKPIVGYWLLFSSALVFGIVVVGGLTRLTESGLSIVEWNLIKGMRPPRSEQEWIDEFEKYKQFPEYKLLNQHMTLEEFKFIFYMEWAHRLLGRVIGLAFVLPGAYFAYRGYMAPSTRRLAFVIACMIGGQGVLGWYMVKSGLSNELLETPHAVPRVSHYWLSAHLTSAFIIYSLMFTSGILVLKHNRAAASSLAINPALSPLRKYTHQVATLVFLTAISGALVAGLDAGLIYNEFPFMGNHLVPDDMWALSTFSERNPNPISWIRNLLENPSAVQFNHRLLACTTFTAISALWLYARRLPLPPMARIAVHSLMGVAVVQVTLGISTLLFFVPVPLAAAHQAGSLTLLTVAMWLMTALRNVPK